MKNTVRDTVRRAKRDAKAFAYFRVLMLEPVDRLELTTCCLQNSASPFFTGIYLCVSLVNWH